MSHTLLRGGPTAAHLYLDGILDEVLEGGLRPGGGGRDTVTLTQILLHCMKKNPDNVFMINGATGRKVTNGEILKQAVSLARKLVAEGVRGKAVLLMLITDEITAAVYFALLFAGALPIFMFPTSTVVEISYFLKQLEPCMVFCDERFHEDVKAAVSDFPDLQPQVVVPRLQEPPDERDVASFQVPDADMDETVMLVTTSGSSGLPKACLITHRGLIAKLALPWVHSTKIPAPTALVFLTGTPTEIVFHRVVASCVVYGVPVLLPHADRSEEWVRSALLTYKPTWMKVMPLFGKSLLADITAEHLSSLQTILLSGSQPCYRTKAGYMELLPKSAVFEEAYGMTEAHGVVASSVNGEPLACSNIFEFKLVDHAGNQLGPCSTGELCIKGPALAKGYYRNNEQFLQNGWYKTGDLFYVDENERLFYQDRKGVCFKYNSLHVSPEEVERVISSIPGVSASAVCLTSHGVAAAVVARGVSYQDVHDAVNGALSPHKHLKGGVGFVSSLPLSHSGKLDRPRCNALIHRLVTAGNCH